MSSNPFPESKRHEYVKYCESHLYSQISRSSVDLHVLHIDNKQFITHEYEHTLQLTKSQPLEE